MSEHNASPEGQAQLLIDKLIKGQNVYKFFTDSMRKTLLISGHTYDHWYETFHMDIPVDNMTPALCRELGLKIMELHQEATFYYAAAQAKAQWLKRGSESTFNDRLFAIVQEHKAKGGRVPGQDTLKALASVGNEEFDSAHSLADIEVKFWRSILEHLAQCRRLVENASLTMSTELKYLSGHGLGA